MHTFIVLCTKRLFYNYIESKKKFYTIARISQKLCNGEE